MAFGILSLLISAALLFFAALGIRSTVGKYRQSHGLVMVRDLMKYATLFIAVFITCIGLAGLLGLLLDSENVRYGDRLDAARWLAFIVVGTPVIYVIGSWIRRDFRKDPLQSQFPAWQIYLLAANTVSLLIWFVPLATALQWIVGEEFRPRELAQSIVAFAVWLVHAILLRSHQSITSNIHRFIGWATGITAGAIALIQVFDYAISESIGVKTGKYDLPNAWLLLAVSVPVALYYWSVFEYTSGDQEARIYRTFAGMVLPSIGFAVAASLSLNAILVWNFGSHIEDASRFFTSVPQQMGSVIVLAPLVWYFRHLTLGYSRDNITRLYQYLMSGLALIGVGLAFGWAIAGLFEITDFPNTFITGLSGLIVTLPLWLVQWRKCQHAADSDFEIEYKSPIRRVYLYASISAATITSIGAAISLFYLIFKAMLVGGFDWLTIKAPGGTLISAGVIALYQLRAYRDHQMLRKTAVTLPKMAH